MGLVGAALAVAAAVAALVLRREQLEARIHYLTGRTPGWLLPVIVQKPWLSAQPLCAEGARCTFKEEDFLIPEGTLNDSAVHHFFTTVASKMTSRTEAVAVALHKRYLRRLGSGGAMPQMGTVYIGPSVLNDQEVAELSVFDGACGGASRLVLVEPLEPIIRELSARASRIGMGPLRTVVVNAAVCPSAGGAASLWKLREGVAPEDGKMDLARQWSSLSRDVLLKTWRWAVAFFDWPGELRHEEDLEEWVVEAPVKCHTPSTLLEAVGMPVGGVDFLLIDAEGYDADILALFMDLPGFNPAVVIFEWALVTGMREQPYVLPGVVNRWSQKGYAIYRDVHDLVMFRTDGN